VLKADWLALEGDYRSDQAKGLSPPPQEKAPIAGKNVVSLPPVAELAAEGPALLGLLRSRKSRRAFSDRPISLTDLSWLCWADLGIRDLHKVYSFRTAPSGGARQPLDLYIYASKVEGLAEGLYRYLPVEHALVELRLGEESALLDKAIMGQFWSSAAVFVWVAVPYRTEWRYGPVSEKLILLDAGHSCENHYLACEAIGLGTCAVASYDQAALDSFLGLDGRDELAVYVAPVGWPR
jgi:SagB-type dehydrogenase family enzyme